jgi:hypothetical protein
LLIDGLRSNDYYTVMICIQSNSDINPCGGDWRLVSLLVFKTSVGSIRSRVGSIPIRLRHFLNCRQKIIVLSTAGRYN